MALATIMLVPGLATLWTAWQKFAVPVPPAPLALSLAGAGALAVNLTCALLLARFRAPRRQPDAGGVSVGAQRRLRQRRHRRCRLRHGLATLSAWPDLIVGLGIAALNADAAREVMQAARKEHVAARP